MFADKQAFACGGLSVYTKFCTPSIGQSGVKPKLERSSSDRHGPGGRKPQRDKGIGAGHGHGRQVGPTSLHVRAHALGDPAAQQVRVDAALQRHARHRHTRVQARPHHLGLGLRVIHRTTIVLAPRDQAPDHLCVDL